MMQVFPQLDKVLELERLIARAKLWRRCRLVPVGARCSCGKHIAVILVDRITGQQVEASVCPRVWRDACVWCMDDRQAWIEFRNMYNMERYSWKRFVEEVK